MTHVEPDGSLLDASNVTLMNTFLTDGLGRFFGPWLARVITDNGSQDIYALQQIAGILLFVIAAEVVLATRVVHLPVALMSPNAIKHDSIGEHEFLIQHETQ